MKEGNCSLNEVKGQLIILSSSIPQSTSIGHWWSKSSLQLTLTLSLLSFFFLSACSCPQAGRLRGGLGVAAGDADSRLESETGWHVADQSQLPLGWYQSETHKLCSPVARIKCCHYTFLQTTDAFTLYVSYQHVYSMNHGSSCISGDFLIRRRRVGVAPTGRPDGCQASDCRSGHFKGAIHHKNEI